MNVLRPIHDRIIDEDLWNAVQEKLTSNAHHNIKRTRSRDVHLLKGLLFDKDGNPYRPVHTQKKKSRRYRYYENPVLKEDEEHPDKLIARLPAGEIEKAVTDTITDHFSSSSLIGQMLGMDEIIDHTTLGYISRNINDAMITDIITACLYKVTVTRESVSVEFNIPALVKKLENDLRIALDVNTETDAFEISAPFKTKRSFGGTIIIEPENAEKDPIDLPPQQLKNLVRGVIWRDEHFAGMSMRAIARRENMSEAGIRKIIMGSFDTLMNL